MIIFVSGLYSTAVERENLHSYILKTWALYGVKIGAIFSYDQIPDIVGKIKQVPVNEKIVVVGFSFGGDAAVRAIQQSAPRMIDGLLLLDPVHFPSPSASDANFKSPDTVGVSFCWTRETKRNIHSVGLNGGPNYTFHVDPHVSEAVDHGWIVRNPKSVVAMIKNILAVSPPQSLPDKSTLPIPIGALTVAAGVGNGGKIVTIDGVRSIVIPVADEIDGDDLVSSLQAFFASLIESVKSFLGTK